MQLKFICVALFFYTGVTGMAQAGGIYKWTDSEGVTHFGSTPPPTSETKVQGSVEKIQDGSSSTNRSGQISGSWWGVLNGYTTSLYFRGDDFSISRHEPTSFDLNITEIASGKFRIENGFLVLTYFKHALEPIKVDQDESFEILSNNGAQLQLAGKNAETLLFRTLVSNSSSPIGRDLSGEWKSSEDIHIRYIFKQGILQLDRIRSSGGRGKIALANWEWNDPELNIEYVVDFLIPMHKPKSLRWNLRNKTNNQFDFVDVGTGKIITLIRVR